jgi:hypothetical protein
MTYIRFHSSLDKSAFSLPKRPKFSCSKNDSSRKNFQKKWLIFLGIFFSRELLESSADIVHRKATRFTQNPLSYDAKDIGSTLQSIHILCRAILQTKEKERLVDLQKNVIAQEIVDNEFAILSNDLLHIKKVVQDNLKPGAEGIERWGGDRVPTSIGEKVSLTQLTEEFARIADKMTHPREY